MYQEKDPLLKGLGMVSGKTVTDSMLKKDYFRKRSLKITEELADILLTHDISHEIKVNRGITTILFNDYRTKKEHVIIISSNDISMFNPDGKELGCWETTHIDYRNFLFYLRGSGYLYDTTEKMIDEKEDVYGEDKVEGFTQESSHDIHMEKDVVEKVLEEQAIGNVIINNVSYVLLRSNMVVSIDDYMILNEKDISDALSKEERQVLALLYEKVMRLRFKREQGEYDYLVFERGDIKI